MVVQTSETDFAWSPDLLSVSYTVTNTGMRAVYLDACDGVPLANVDRMTDGAGSGGNAVCLAIYSTSPVRLDAHRSLQASIGLQAQADTPYRLRLFVGRSPSSPFDWVFSNGFNVH